MGHFRERSLEGPAVGFLKSHGDNNNPCTMPTLCQAPSKSIHAVNAFQLHYLRRWLPQLGVTKVLVNKRMVSLGS